MYRQFTLFALQQLLTHGVTANALTVLETAYQSLKSGFRGLSGPLQRRPAHNFHRPFAGRLVTGLIAEAARGRQPGPAQPSGAGHHPRGQRRRGRRISGGGQLLAHTRVQFHRRSRVCYRLFEFPRPAPGDITVRAPGPGSVGPLGPAGHDRGARGVREPGRPGRRERRARPLLPDRGAHSRALGGVPGPLLPPAARPVGERPGSR